MEGLQLFLLVAQIIIAVVLIILVLIQKSDGDSLSGISSGAGSLSGAMSRRTSASVLSKTTMTLIVVFMLNCLVLASITNRANKALKDELEKAAASQTVDEPTKDTSPSAPPVE